jgi:multidrug efflux pump subunit AcrA (membrane-fusion protein)
VVAAVAFRLVRSKGFNPTQIESIIESMRWGAGWLEALPLSRSLESASSDVAKAFTCLDVLAGIEDSADLKSTAIAIANTLATQLKCDRVSVGVRRRSGRSRVIALSHSADFRRKAQLIEAIENAMEEAMDQRSTVVYPEIPQAQRTVSIAHRTLCEASRAENPAAMSLLLSDCKGELVGAVTLERSNGIKFDADAMQLSEAITALIGPVFGLQAQLNRPISGRLAASAAHAVSAIFGPGRPTLKIGAVCAAGLLGLAATLQSDYRISAKSIVEPDIRRAAAAPFDGFIRTAKVRAGDAVKSGDLLASLDEQGLQLERSKWQAERNKLIQKQRDAIAKHNRSELVVLDLQIKETQSQTDLAEDNLRRSKILAPFDGTIVSGDLSQMLGAPVEKGKVLFEIAPLATHRVILHVDERDIRYVATGQSGSMALAGMPSTPLPLVLGKITPVTFKEDGRNVFYVEAQLVETNPLLRPGMEGVAKINVGERPVLWIWTRTLFEWLRLSIWQLLP